MISKLPLIALFATFSAFALPCQPINGCTGVSNNNADTITLGGAINTSGAFTLTGAYGTTITVTATTAITLPSGTHTLASNDGSNASGTWAINITGTAGGVSGILPQANGGSGNDASYYVPSALILQDAGGGHFNSTGNLTYNGFGLNVGNFINALNVNLSNLTASQLTGTDSSKNLSSGNLSGDVTSSGFSTVLATVNSSPGTYGSATQVPVITVNGKGLATAVSNVTISGVPPGGSASGSFLNGTYPNPGLVNNSITNTQLAQMPADTFKGNNTGSTANAIDLTVAQAKTLLNLSGTNLGDVTLSGQNYLSLTGQALTANAVNLNSSNVTSILPVGNGGNGTGFEQLQGILWNNGSINTSNANLVTDGQSLINFQTATGASNNLELLLNNQQAGVANTSSVQIRRADQANGQAYTQFFTYGSPSLSWEIGFLANDANFYLQSFNGTALTVSQSGVFNFPTYTVSQLAAFDSAHNLISSNLSGDLTTSGTVATLASVNSNVGSFGSPTQVATFTVNAKGLITAASNVTISGVPPGGSAGGDLTGTYPNPTVVSNAITYAKFQQVAANSLIGNATGSLANATGITLGSTLTFSGSALQTTAMTGDISSSANSFATTLATVNTRVGTFGSASVVPQVTLNGKGLVTDETDVTITPAAIGAPTATGTGASGTWAINVTGSSGTSTTATNANNGATVSTSTNASYFPLFVASSTNSNQPFNLGTGLSFNPSTNNLTTTTFTGALNGNATTASGAPPIGSAGGDLTGTYPNPTVTSNAVTYAKFQQVAANSVVGNSTGSTANATAIAFSATGGTSNIASRDANGNSRSNNTGSVATLVTSAAGTTTLTAASTKYQVLQGTTTQTYTLPDATTLFVGNAYQFRNESTGTLTVNNNGGSLIATIPGGGSASLVCTAIGTANGSWDVASSLPYATANTATTLVERDGSGNFSAGTITAALNGNATTASGAPPTGAAGGSFLNGTYPNPGLVNNSIGNAQLRQSAGLSVIGNSTSSTANVADITSSASGQVLTSNGSTLAFGPVNLASSNSVGSSVLPIGNGGTNTASETTNGVAYYDGSKITTSANFYFSPTALTLSNAGSVSAPTLATELNLSSTTQDSARLVLSGQEFYQSSNTSTDGVALVLGANRSGNRQVWFVDTANSAVNSTNAILRVVLNPVGLGTYIDSVSTNGNTFLPIGYGNTGAATTIDGSSIALTGGDVTDSTGNLLIATVNKGITIKSAAVSGGTANAAVVTGITLSGGTATINDSYINTSTVCYFSVVTAAGTIATGGYKVTVGSGTATIAGGTLDTSTGNLACIKGN